MLLISIYSGNKMENNNVNEIPIKFMNISVGTILDNFSIHKIYLCNIQIILKILLLA